MTVLAAQPSLPMATSARMRLDRYRDATAKTTPVTVLGYEAVRILGIGTLNTPTQILLG